MSDADCTPGREPHSVAASYNGVVSYCGLSSQQAVGVVSFTVVRCGPGSCTTRPVPFLCRRSCDASKSGYSFLCLFSVVVFCVPDECLLL